MLQGYKNSAGVGYHVNFEDPLGFARSASPPPTRRTASCRSDERGHVDVTVATCSGERSCRGIDRTFTTCSARPKRSRKGYAAKLGYDDLLICDEPRRLTLCYDLAYYDKIDTLPNAQNIQTNFTRLLIGEVGLHYTDVRRSLGAVDDEKGIAWEVVDNGSQVSGEIAPHFAGRTGFPFPLAHSSVWLRSAAGVANGDRSNPVANFYFGGLATTTSTTASSAIAITLRCQASGSTRSAQSFVREMVEWNLPPFVFESVGTPGFYLNWLRPSVFARALWADPGSDRHRAEYQNIGGQVDLSCTVLHRYTMTLSAGYAAGREPSGRTENEWMASLKIL